MKSKYEPNVMPLRRRISAFVSLSLLLWLAGFAPLVNAQTASPSVGDQISTAAGDAKEKVQDAGQAASNKLDQLWRRIEESRLKNRTPDEIVACVIIGLLIAGLIRRTTGTSTFATFVFGLVGAFVGGIVAHVTQLDLGMGPVLVRYEDLLFAAVGGLLIVWAGRKFLQRKQPKK